MDVITTKICRNCVEKINDIVLFREICASTNTQLRILLSNQIGESPTGDVDTMPGDATGTQFSLLGDFASGAGNVTPKRKHTDVDFGGEDT